VADCVFCRIASGEMEAEVLHSSEKVVAFRDAHPQAPTHILLVPREHLASLQGLGNSHADMLSELFQTAARLAEEEGVDRSGWRMVVNVGSHAGQVVFHLHFHLMGGRPMGRFA